MFPVPRRSIQSKSFSLILFLFWSTKMMVTVASDDEDGDDDDDDGDDDHGDDGDADGMFGSIANSSF
jgi:hypothetical protein